MMSHVFTSHDFHHDSLTFEGLHSKTENGGRFRMYFVNAEVDIWHLRHDKETLYIKGKSSIVFCLPMSAFVLL